MVIISTRKLHKSATVSIKDARVTHSRRISIFGTMSLRSGFFYTSEETEEVITVKIT